MLKKWVALVAFAAISLCAGRTAVAEGLPTSEGYSQTTNPVLPVIKRDSLLNGLQLIVIEQQETGSVSVRLRINSGATFDLAGKGGLADLTAGMLLKGGGGHNAANVAETVNQLGLTVSVLTGWDSTDINISGPADSLDEIFDLLGRLIITPAFDQKELDALKAQRVAEIKAEGERDQQAVYEKAMNAVFGTHPFGKPARGTVESLAQITRHDLIAHHKRFYLANNAELVVTGDATAEAVTKLARSKLGSWKKGDRVPATFRPAEAHAARRIIILDRPEAQQSYAVVAQPGASRRAEDYFPAAVMAEALGALNSKAARSNATTVATQLDARYLQGPLVISIKSSPDEVAATIESVLANMNQMRTGQPSLDSVEQAKSRVANSIAEKLRTNDGAASLISDIELYGLGRDYLINFGDRINAITPADVLKAAQAYLSPQTVAIVVSGPAAKLEGELKKFGAVTVAR